jgi:hypothetical protein
MRVMRHYHPVNNVSVAADIVASNVPPAANTSANNKFASGSPEGTEVDGVTVGVTVILGVGVTVTEAVGVIVGVTVVVGVILGVGGKIGEKVKSQAVESEGSPKPPTHPAIHLALGRPLTGAPRLLPNTGLTPAGIFPIMSNHIVLIKAIKMGRKEDFSILPILNFIY